MAVVKNLLVSVAVLGLSGTAVQAAPLNRPGGSWRWTTWVSNRETPGGGYSISGPSSSNPFLAPLLPQAATDPVPVSQPVAPAASGTLQLTASSQPAPVPVITPAISESTYSAPVPMAASVPASVGAVDAYINLGSGPYPNADNLTTGGAQPWYDSPTAIQAFGGVPNSQQQQSFDQTVLSHVQQTFQLSGLNPSLTIDPSIPANHTLSVVSNTSNGNDSNTIGMTEVGGSGFGYIDKLSSLKLSSDQLAWAVAHNVAHELMHAFGVGSHPDQTGKYLDSASATQSVLTDPNTTFSPAAVELMRSTDFGATTTGNSVGAQTLGSDSNHVGPNCCCIFCHGLYGDHSVDAQHLEAPVPEPATVLIWAGAIATIGWKVNRKRLAK